MQVGVAVEELVTRKVAVLPSWSLISTRSPAARSYNRAKTAGWWWALTRPKIVEGPI